jgi:hypothetical protein
MITKKALLATAAFDDREMLGVNVLRVRVALTDGRSDTMSWCRAPDG